MNSTHPLRRSLRVASVLAVMLTSLAFASPADAALNTDPGPSTPSGAVKASLDASANPGGQRRHVPRHSKGRQAVERLGRESHEIATETDLTVEEVTDAVLDDESLQVADDGTLEAADSLGGTGAYITTGSSNTLLWSVGSTNYLHSRPSAPLKIFLDFNGHTTSGTQWNTQYSSFTTPVWGRDNDATTWSTAEAAAIQQAFASVAEDFAPFDVDVTTQDPGVEGLRRTSSTDYNYGIRVVVGPNNWMAVNNSGYAKIGSFNWNSDTPAYCFATYATPTKQIAECISHEAGHTVGLLHDGTTYGQEYYPGHANWAPIMGNPYGKAVTQWSRGEYPGANNRQDDLAVIGSYLGWVRDDYTGTTATKATLPANTTRGGAISYGSGEYDAFKFSLTRTSTLNIQAWEWFQAVDPNLNLRVQVTNAAGKVVASHSPTGSTRTNMNVRLGAGTYYVFVDGVGQGSAATGYTNYASMGYYNLYLQFI